MLRCKKVWIIVYTFVFILSFTISTNAMHIMEGYLSPGWSIAWGILSIPAIFVGIKKIKKLNKNNKDTLILLAMAGAFTFVLSALKIPSVTASSSHMTGLGFAAIIFGPSIASVLSLIVLLFQALLLAHGGLTTLGANIFSMGIAGPIITYLIYIFLNKTNSPKKINIFLAAALGDLVTYIVTSLQLALDFLNQAGGFMASFTKFMSVFALTQIPLAIIEGILTVILINMIQAYNKNIFSRLENI